MTPPYLHIWQDLSFIQDALGKYREEDFIKFLELVRDDPERAQIAAQGYLAGEKEAAS